MSWVGAIFSFVGWKIWFILITVLIICLYCWYTGKTEIHVPTISPSPIASSLPPLPPSVLAPTPSLPASVPDLPVFPGKLKKAGNGRGKCQKIKEGWVRKILEEHYGLPFPTIRDPDLIPNPNPRYARRYPLELDCYNAELKIAAEYQGEQHYMYPDPAGWNKSKADWEKRLRYDRFKAAECERKGIYLIRVPYHQAKTEESVRQFMLPLLIPGTRT